MVVDEKISTSGIGKKTKISSQRTVKNHPKKSLITTK
jgi:hypothetical protein